MEDVKEKQERNKKIMVQVSDEEVKIIERQANSLGLSISAYLRYLIHKEDSKKVD